MKRQRLDDDSDDPGPIQRNVRGRGAHRGGREGNNKRKWRWEPRDQYNDRHQQFGHQAEAMQYDDLSPQRYGSLSRPRPQYGRGNQNHDGNDNFRGIRRNTSQGDHGGRNNFRGNFNHENQSSRNDNQRRNPTRPLGFKKLEDLAKSEPKETLGKVVELKNPFMELLQSSIEQFDYFVLISEIIAKVCRSSFDEMKSKLLLEICNSNYVVSFKSQLIDLPYTQVKRPTDLYWKDQESFWRNFVEFCECIVNLSPTLALNKCRSLLEATSIACLDGLKDRHGFNLPEDCSAKLVELRQRITDFEKVNVVKVVRTSKRYGPEDGTPPEDFRELSLMPTREDLIHSRPFIRPNIVNGGYQDVEHYLDVQFRLLREDCFGPLRDGLGQYLDDPQKKKYDNIRVFRDVKFLKPYVSQTRVGSLVQLNLNNNRMFKRTNWSHNKRFIFGSLVLFTKDDFKTFIAATILDREEEYLVRGLIPVHIIGQGFNVGLYNDDSYIMIESEVYFEPYYHVLKVLQEPSFPQHLAMKQYIVDVKPDPQPPSYLQADTEFIVEIEDENTMLEEPKLITLTDENLIGGLEIEGIDFDMEEENKINGGKFIVLQEETWPGKEAFGFNDSQYDAYKLALTHEFAVIQGPPGTGKTYLGIKVAKTLYENMKHEDGCLMLVICYTNHALDQFLEALLGITDSIVRIGGQSRNEAMDAINITKLRRQISIHSQSHRAFINQKMELQSSIKGFQRSLVRLDVLLNGVPKVDYIADFLPVEEPNLITYLQDYYEESNITNNVDPLFYWLFENNYAFLEDIGVLFEENTTDNADAKHEKEKRKRTGVVLDEYEDDKSEMMSYRRRISSFTVETVSADIKNLVVIYRRTDPYHWRQKRAIENELQLLNSHKALYTEMSKHRLRRTNLRIGAHTNFSTISLVDRWTLYFGWIHNVTNGTRHEVGNLQEIVNKATIVYEESRMMLDMQVLRGMKIVGMTTSGAARMRKLLQTLDPPVVIVEEAAEVLEQHIITSLTKGCKHLILIGDHQQLRPSASHMRLAKHFKLEVSLFERMITNGIHSRRLSVQHRMRPEIAALICPHIYPELENHPSVFNFPDVKGMAKNLYFYSHEFQEDVVQDNMSRTNHAEADLTLALANYLMQQGYRPEDVTILAAYKGQMFYMRKERVNYAHLIDVKIAVVDNYQGEESKIILLSLVRNNVENNIGFLGTANRICVALSRAKHGFYIFGNIEILKAEKTGLWRNIAATLEGNESLGSKLTLQCQSHTDNMTIIDNLKDFQKVPEGGCLLRCEAKLPRCGHSCALFCHGYDRTHATNSTRCNRMCERILCELNHVCPDKCAVQCGPCRRRVLKKLPCGHELEVYCHQPPEDPDIRCHTMVEVTLPDCEHKANKLCYVKIKDIRCEGRCENRVEKCGHSCRKKCHVYDDPEHAKYLCMKKCAKAKHGCKAEVLDDRGEHQCLRKCHETCGPCDVQVVKKRTTCKHGIKVECHIDPDTAVCEKRCARFLECGHFCMKMCKEPCGDCDEPVTKVIPDCGHKVKTTCKKEPTRDLCKSNCERTMDCGHRCKGVCGKQCDSSQCMEPSQKELSLPCGHRVKLPCKMTRVPVDELKPAILLSLCVAPCAAELACKHVCGGSCARCRQGRLHAPCAQICNQTNICGHQCEEPCNQICPPCKKKCEVQCQHNKCGMLCGAPCKSCKEKCGRSCPHGACKRLCGEKCSLYACDEPCPLSLACGHACRGLCGEPCPPVCKPCQQDDFPVDFLGDAYEDTDRFILLQDCGHVLDVDNMENLMLGDSETVKIRCCPKCRKPIINTRRYKDLVNATFKNEINPIKLKVYGTKAVIAATTEKLKAEVESFRNKYIYVLQASSNCRLVYLNLQSIVKRQKNVSKLQLDMELICLNILDMIADCYKSYLESKATELKEELTTQVKLLCNIFVFQLNKSMMLKVSEQQQTDVRLEIRRLNAIVQLAKLVSHAAFTSAKSSPAVASAYETATTAVFKPGPFLEEDTIAALRKLQEAVKVSGVVTQQERQLIVKALGAKAGSWYKCPNGHFYCIADCGGAVMESKCGECDARIGGSSHRLRHDNAHAPEIDGSRFAAWSEQYNMANFDLDL